MCSPDLAAALVSKWSGSKAFSAGEEGSPGVQRKDYWRGAETPVSPLFALSCCLCHAWSLLCRGIFFSMAAVQGFDANVMQITQGKLHRNRRQRFLPFVVGSSVVSEIESEQLTHNDSCGPCVLTCLCQSVMNSCHVCDATPQEACHVHRTCFLLLFCTEAGDISTSL
eukprot:4778558-Amphidinium_carterae.1